VGLLGIAGGNVISKQSDKTLTTEGGNTGESKFYPGFGGTTLGGGLMLDLRFIKLLGQSSTVAAKVRGKRA